MTLNSAQLQAVNHVDGPLLVLAGAGSGKTRVITHKIAALVDGRGVPANRVCAVTFTNKAAREMRERAAVLLGEDRASGVRISTFHRLGLDIVRREYGHLGLKRNFTLMDAADSRALVKEALHQQSADADEAVDACRSAISRWKNELIAPGEAMRDAADDLEAQRARQYAAYEEALRSYNALDFDDLLLLPVRLFETSDSALAGWRDRIAYLLVDEYQDTNLAQYRMVRQLIGDRGVLTVVGDDDQSIYAWRGARPENLRVLADDYPDLTVIKLEQNYRSSRRILSAANALIANNPHVFEKRLWSDTGHGDPLRVVPAGDGRDEADRVAIDIQTLSIARRVRWNEIAVLYRSNHQARPFEQALRARGIPCRVAGGPSFFERPEIRDVMAYLRIIANPEDDAAFLRVLNVPRREIGPVTVGRLGDYAASRGQSLFEASLEAGLHGVMGERAADRVQRFARGVVGWQDAAERGADPAGMLRDLIQEIDYPEWLRETCRSPQHEERCRENIDEFAEWIEKLGEKDGQTGLTGLLGRLALMDMLDRQDGDTAGDAVSLMTLHAAKGLEFPHVFLVGVEEELLPHRASLEADDIEEERRLAYVGITRAMRGLTITYARRRSRYGETVECAPSRFLDELPAELLQWEGREAEVSPEERKARGRAAIADLRSLLAES
jgi:ATP-dependent DNA helicase Rep